MELEQTILHKGMVEGFKRPEDLGHAAIILRSSGGDVKVTLIRPFRHCTMLHTA